MTAWCAGGFQPLWAYIDPGTGSLVFQMLVAGLLTTGLMFRGLRDRLVTLLSRLLPRSATKSTDAVQSADPTQRSTAGQSQSPAPERPKRSKAA